MNPNTQSDDEVQADGALRQFERNRFFRGKLMTARDMEVEQAYHADRLHTLARFTAGTGIVRGLTVRSVETCEEGLTVTVAPGLAIDGIGRPIVVDRETTRTVPKPGGDELFLQVRHAAVERERVPVPNVEEGTVDSRTHNRTVESVEVTYRESPPIDRPPELSCDDDEALRTAIDRYRRERRRASECRTDPAVFVGAFRRAEDGTWDRDESGPTRPLVYDNDLLFELLSARLGDDSRQDSETPTETASRERSGEQLRRELEEVRTRQDDLRRYVTGKAITDTSRVFGTVADRFSDHDGNASRTARELARQASRADSVLADPTAYRRLIGELLETAAGLETSLDGVATTESSRRFREAVETLDAKLDADADRVALAMAHDDLVVAGGDLQPVGQVVPEP